MNSQRRHKRRSYPDIALSPAFQGVQMSVIHALLCATDHAILMTDHRGNDILCNPRFGELFDVDPEAIVRATRDEVRQISLSRIQNPEEFTALLDRIYADPTLELEDEVKLVTDPPRLLRRYTAPVYDTDGNNIGRVWTFQDVTETRRLQAEVETYAARLEEQFQRQADDFRATTEVLNAMTAISSALAARSERAELVQAIIQVISPLLEHECAALLLREESDLLTGFCCTPDRSLCPLTLHADNEPALSCALRATPPEEGSSLTLYSRYDSPLAKKLECHTLIVAALGWEKRAVGILILGTNRPLLSIDPHSLTHLHAIVDQVSLALKTQQLQAALQTAYNELRAAEEQVVAAAKLGAVGTLAASIAHDIRNIMTPLQIELAVGEGASLDAVRIQVDRLSALTHRLLSLSRPAKVEMGPIQLQDALRHVLPLVQPQADVDGVVIRTQFARMLPHIYGDKTRLEHLFINLLLNAIHAMAKRGGALTIEAVSDEDCVRVDVQDTGMGIESNDLPRIFEPFFTTRANGSGLGLFSVKRIVDEHNGRIEVRSRVGEGTCFTIWFPAVGSQIESES